MFLPRKAGSDLKVVLRVKGVKGVRTKLLKMLNGASGKGKATWEEPDDTLRTLRCTCTEVLP